MPKPRATPYCRDHGALIDWALEQAEEPGSPYAGKLDAERIVAAGNSCGGVTALGVAAADDRVKSVFVLSGSSALASSDANVMGAISAPSVTWSAAPKISPPPMPSPTTIS